MSESARISTQCPDNSQITNKLCLMLNGCDYASLSIAPKIKTGVPSCPCQINLKLSWPETKVGQYAFPAPFCIKPDGCCLISLCENENVPFWPPVTETCEILNDSSITKNLSNVEQAEDKLFQMCELSKDYDQFTVLDIYTTVVLFITVDNKTDLESAFCLINNILNIDSSILMEAQLKVRTTELWLFAIANLIVSTVVAKNLLLEENFGFLEINQTYMDGVTVQRARERLVLTAIPLDQAFDDVLRTENLVSGFWFNHNDKNDFGKYVAYFNGSYFPDSSKNVRGFFGVLNVKSCEIFTFRLILRFNEATVNQSVSCVVWLENDDQFSWIEFGEFEISENFFVCTFKLCDHRNLIVVNSQIIHFGMMMTPPGDLTDNLINIIGANISNIQRVTKLLHESFRYKEFISVDVYLVAVILKKLTTDNTTNLDSLCLIVSNLLHIEKSVLAESQFDYNATNSILDSLDKIIQNHNFDDEFISTSELFAILVVNLTNFSGLVLLDNHTVEILKDSSNASILTKYENLTSALLFSPKLQNQMDNESKIIVNIFFNDALFNEVKKNLKYSVNEIFEVILPKIDGNYSGPISIFQRKRQTFCSYWVYDNLNHSFWKNESKSVNFSTLVRCDFWHTTHFTQLIMDKDIEDDDEFLEWMTNITCSLSLLGYSCIILTAFVCDFWRQKSSTKILLNFVVSGILQIVAFYVSSNVGEEKFVCTFVGAVLHYSVLAQFCWMLNIAILQFRRFVLIFTSHSKHLVLKTCLFGWGFPAIPVGVSLVVDAENYTSNSTGLCYPSGYFLYLGLWFPVLFIMTINFFVFSYVVYTVFNSNDDHIEASIYKWRLVIFLFFMLGLTWIFGFLAEASAGILFAYLFCLLASSQGFVVFIIFIVVNKNVRNFYLRKLFGNT
ncbi:hypothetical protein Zmor_019875 [Zophobas morio]|uniref:G-protein coupled receptors family 2 profile 2 domain-containing protein n=1 Tax=Zophobas morio TaxID=2755281 RepID=A0AA38M9G8_9CUCU|nr:hypothetical protein Zmor_019875 [Zophobas morio]